MLEATLTAAVITLLVTGLVTTRAGLRRISAAGPSVLAAERFATNRVAQIKVHRDYESLQAVFAGTRSDLPRLPGAQLHTAVTRSSRGQRDDHTDITISISGPAIRDTIRRVFTIKAPDTVTTSQPEK